MKDFSKIALFLALGTLITVQSPAQVTEARSVTSIAGGAQAAQASSELSSESITSLRNYIHEAWQTLTRSMTDCRSLADTKLKQQPVLYVPKDSQIHTQVQQIETTCTISKQKLDKRIDFFGVL